MKGLISQSQPYEQSLLDEFRYLIMRFGKVLENVMYSISEIEPQFFSDEFRRLMAVLKDEINSIEFPAFQMAYEPFRWNDFAVHYSVQG
jgi:hypothetical protein